MRAPAPEIALLVDAVTTPDEPRIDCSTFNPARWQFVLEAADWHRVAPLLCRHLRSIEGAPTWVAARLEERYLANAARNVFLADETEARAGGARR
jgi:hypothetical protein